MPGHELAKQLLYELPPKTTDHPNRTYRIFALCLKSESCVFINKMNSQGDVPHGNKITAIRFDVTTEESISYAFTDAIAPWLKASPDRILHCLVNNAGIGTPGFVDMLNVEPAFSSPNSYRNDMEVNFFGMVRGTKETKEKRTQCDDTRASFFFFSGSPRAFALGLYLHLPAGCRPTGCRRVDGRASGRSRESPPRFLLTPSPVLSSFLLFSPLFSSSFVCR